MITQQRLIDNQGGYSDVFPESMPATKIDAFLEEFPWVNKYIKGPICQVYVSRIELKLLDRMLHKIDVGFLDAEYIYEEAYLLDENKEMVVSETEKEYYRRKYLFFGPKVLRKRTIKTIGKVVDTSIGAVMWELGEKAQSVHYILSYYRYTGGVIIYKSPKGIPITEWVRNETDSERVKFQETLKKIDAEAAK